ncbi:MAG: hypothetical protein FWC80_05955 [Firmicutes bacterium]|nr:hypothetical protein [Bacillota bacterium]
MKKIAVMPNLGDYNIPLKILVERCLDMRVIQCPPTTKKTVEVGAKNSPDTICTPYKITLGNFIDCLEQTDATVLIMPGIACRLGLYDVLQKQALEDLGYKFEMLVLFDYAANAMRLYNTLSKYNSGLTEDDFNKVLDTVVRIVLDMDELADYRRRNGAFEITKGEFEKNYKAYLVKALEVKDAAEAKKLGAEYKKVFKSIKVVKPKKPIRIGLIGDLYSVFEPHGNCDIERWLAANGVEIVRDMDLTCTVKTMLDLGSLKQLIASSGGYVDYHIGGVANITVSHAYGMAKRGVDGLIHMKAASCSPEITAMSILQNISRDLDTPIIYLTFDTETSEAGLHTRLEAFLDMLNMKKVKCKK